MTLEKNKRYLMVLVGVAVGLALAASALEDGLRVWIWGAIALAAAEGAVVFSVNRRLIGKPGTGFLAAFVGGIFGRLALLAGFAGAVVAADVAPATPILAFTGLLFFFNLLQFPFLATSR
jgi:hypothetical protein